MSNFRVKRDYFQHHQVDQKPANEPLRKVSDKAEQVSKGILGRLLEFFARVVGRPLVERVAKGDPASLKKELVQSVLQYVEPFRKENEVIVEIQHVKKGRVFGVYKEQKGESLVVKSGRGRASSVKSKDMSSLEIVEISSLKKGAQRIEMNRGAFEKHLFEKGFVVKETDDHFSVQKMGKEVATFQFLYFGELCRGVHLQFKTYTNRRK